MAHSWRWHILHRHVITSWKRTDLLALLCEAFDVFCHFPIWFLGSIVVLDCVDFWVLPSALLFYRKNIKQIFVSETTMPSTLIFGMQHHLVILIQFGAQGLSVDPPAGSHVHYRNLLRESSCLPPQDIQHWYLLCSIT